MDLNAQVDALRDQIIETARELIRIRSVKEAPKEDMPFGEGIQQCLNRTLEICTDMGFDITNVDNYAAHAELGQGSEIVGILAHLDVVPEGDYWDMDPYGAEIINGRLYGRGAIDDKGPAVAALYAMKILKDSGVKLNKKIRMIFGTDEESGWACMEHYFSKMPPPDLGFTPDADFPAIHGEMGILIFDLVKPLENRWIGEGARILSIKGGNRPNMVPDTCEALLEYDHNDTLVQAIESYGSRHGLNIETKVREKQIFIKVHGVSAHGSTPEKGINAIAHTMMLLNALPLASGDMKDWVQMYCDVIGLDCHGQRIGCGLEDLDSGKLVFNVGVLETTHSESVLTVNIRYPITENDQVVYRGIESVLENRGVTLRHHEHQKPIYFPKDHPLIQSLMEVYRDQTGDKDSEPVTIGGGTYARAMKNCVAFGPLMPGMEETAHQKNEYIEVEHLIQMTKIYAHALYKLCV